MKILVVEDDAEKRRHITGSVLSVPGVVMDDVKIATDVFDAKRELARHTYELLILDIALPLRPDGDPQSDAGLQLLEELIRRPDAFNLPTHVIGITAYEEIFSEASGRFASRLLTLLRYDAGSEEWKHGLRARTVHILEAERARGATQREYGCDLVVVCALDNPELNSVRRLPWSWGSTSVVGDHTIYWRGEFMHEEQSKLVYAAACPRMGMPTAAVLSTKMIEAFRPRYIAMVGIAAGIRGRVRLGDVIAADPVWDWGSGKWSATESGQKFSAAPHQIALDVSIREKLRLLADDGDVLSRIRSSWPGDPPDHVLRLHVGPLASGAAVLADDETARRVLDQHRSLLAIEMEAYGVFAAAEEVSEPRPRAFVLKAAVDFADSGKNDRFQSYGSFTSAELLRHFVEKCL